MGERGERKGSTLMKKALSTSLVLPKVGKVGITLVFFLLSDLSCPVLCWWFYLRL